MIATGLIKSNKEIKMGFLTRKNDIFEIKNK